MNCAKVYDNFIRQNFPVANGADYHALFTKLAHNYCLSGFPGGFGFGAGGIGTLRALTSTFILGAGRSFPSASFANEPSSGSPQFCLDSFKGFGELSALGLSGLWESLINF